MDEKSEKILMTCEKMKDRKYLNYLYQFDENMDMENIFKSWLEYKYPKLTTKGINGDLDVSLMAVITYCKELSSYDKSYSDILNKIEMQKEENKFQIRLDDNMEMRGDWLTSPLHIIKLYMGLLWEKEKKQEKSEKVQFVNLFDRTTRAHLLYAPVGTWEEYCYKNSDIIWDSFDDEAKEFLLNTISAGNFIMMPIYINPCRCMSFGGDDTVDTLLWKMYNCFNLKNEEDKFNDYLKNAFSGNKAEEARKNIVYWMNIFNNSWDTFVKYNFLEGFVKYNGGQFGRPIDLRSGKEIDLDIGEKFSPMPRDIAEFKNMFINYNKYVEARKNKIYELVSSK